MMSSNQNKSFKTKLRTIKKELISTTSTLTRSKSSSSTTSTTMYANSMTSLSSPYSSLQPSPFSSTNTSPRSIVSATFASSSLVQSTPDLSQEQQQQQHHQHSSSSSFRYRSQSFSQSFVKLTQSNNKHNGSHFHLPLHNHVRQQSNAISHSPYESTFDTCIPLDYDHFTYTNTKSPKLTPEEDELSEFYYNDNTNANNASAAIKEEITIPPLPDIHEFNSRYQQRQQLQHQSSYNSSITTGNNSSTSLNRYNSEISRNGSISLKNGNMSRSVSLVSTTNLTPSTPISLTHSKTNSIDVYGREYDGSNGDGYVKEVNEEQEDDLAINILNVINKNEISWDI
ncbi:hypothetical protein CORT_0F03010 [Candida orthopsilosis Co 90-125]|uniref:Uncharacterized protein n=1 Tax=Candida orthopsilosis (strain 90-125) TaxID=1136231 RepID=H8X8Q0_CANO9|nr:hypothetical protein CORT_0F03010 [Candida orthopsilosis Co 90-125]CCG24525.1 hypothetical protein CORT_0F03010 [Candida orthopsilosis Co 90-125]